MNKYHLVNQSEYHEPCYCGEIVPPNSDCPNMDKKRSGYPDKDKSRKLKLDIEFLQDELKKAKMDKYASRIKNTTY